MCIRDSFMFIAVVVASSCGVVLSTFGARLSTLTPHRAAAGTPPEDWKGAEEGDAAGTGTMAPKAETLTRQRKLHADTVSLPVTFLLLFFCVVLRRMGKNKA